MERVSQIKTALEAVGLRSYEIGKDDLVKYLLSYYNPRMGGDLSIKDLSAIKMQ